MLLYLHQKTDSHGRSFRKASGDSATSVAQHGQASALATDIGTPEHSPERAEVICHL